MLDKIIPQGDKLLFSIKYQAFNCLKSRNFKISDHSLFLRTTLSKLQEIFQIKCQIKSLPTMEVTFIIKTQPLTQIEQIRLKVKVQINYRIEKYKQQVEKQLNLLNTNNHNQTLLGCLGKFDEDKLYLLYHVDICKEQQKHKVTNMLKETIKIILNKYIILYGYQEYFYSKSYFNNKRSHKSLLQNFKGQRVCPLKQLTQRAYEHEQSQQDGAHESFQPDERDTQNPPQIRTIITDIKKNGEETTFSLKDQHLNENKGTLVQRFEGGQFIVSITNHNHTFQNEVMATKIDNYFKKSVNQNCEDKELKQLVQALNKRQNFIYRQCLKNGENIVHHYNYRTENPNIYELDKSVLTRDSGDNAYKYIINIRSSSQFVQKLILIMYLAFRGLRSTHANKVIHSDAELKNFIVSVYLNMYVWADFAYGTIYENNEGLQELLTIEGSQKIEESFKRILQREGISYDERHNPKYDIWKMFNGLCMRIIKGQLDKKLQIQSKCSNLLKQSLLKLFQQNKSNKFKDNMELEYILKILYLLLKEKEFINNVHKIL